MKALRLALSWFLFFLGELASRLQSVGMPYEVYNWLMTTSERLQGDYERGPWSNAE